MLLHKWVHVTILFSYMPFGLNIKTVEPLPLFSGNHRGKQWMGQKTRHLYQNLGRGSLTTWLWETFSGLGHCKITSPVTLRQLRLHCDAQRQISEENMNSCHSCQLKQSCLVQWIISIRDERSNESWFRLYSIMEYSLFVWHKQVHVLIVHSADINRILKVDTLMAEQSLMSQQMKVFHSPLYFNLQPDLSHKNLSWVYPCSLDAMTQKWG